MPWHGVPGYVPQGECCRIFELRGVSSKVKEMMVPVFNFYSIYLCFSLVDMANGVQVNPNSGERPE